MTEEKNAEFLLREYQLLGAQHEALEKQMQLLISLIEEFQTTVTALETVGKQKKGEEVLIPLGSGSYAYGTLSDAKNVLVNIGAETLSKRTVEEGMEIMEARKTELEETQKRTLEELSRVQKRTSELEPELRKVLGQSH